MLSAPSSPVPSNMTRTLHIILVTVVLIIATLLGDAWLSARRSSAQLASSLATQNAAIQQAATREDLRATQLSAALATIKEQKRRVVTPQEAAAAIPSLLPQLPLPLTIDLPDITALPNQQYPPPASISVPQSDLKPIYDDLQDCRICALQRDSIEKKLADEQTKVAALTHERDIAIAAARGGSFWSRLKHEAKWFLIGVAAGAAATAVLHH